MLGCFVAAFVGIVVAFFLVKCLRKDGTIKPRRKRKKKIEEESDARALKNKRESKVNHESI